MTDLRFATARLLAVSRDLPGDLARLAGQLLTAGRGRLIADPPVALLGILRRVRPVLRLGPLTLYTAGVDVERILGDTAGYRVSPYGDVGRDLIGEFALGVDGDRHAHLRADLDRRLDIVSRNLQPWADQAATRIYAEASGAGAADPVAELGWRLPTAFVAERGLAPPAADDPENTALAGWAADIYEACFANLARDRGVAARGRRASAALATRGLSTAEIGLVVGAIPTVAEAVTRAVPMLRADAQRWAAVCRAAAVDDHALLWSLVAEALRFSPQAPGLLRAPAHAPGRLVLASTYSAMHDPARVTCPNRFRSDRPEQAYLHFGSGPHRCAGEHSATVLLTAAVRAVALADTGG